MIQTCFWSLLLPTISQKPTSVWKVIQDTHLIIIKFKSLNLIIIKLNCLSRRRNSTFIQANQLPLCSKVAEVSKARNMLVWTAWMKAGLPKTPCVHLQCTSMEGHQDHSVKQVSQRLYSLLVNQAELWDAQQLVTGPSLHPQCLTLAWYLRGACSSVVTHWNHREYWACPWVITEEV